MELKIIHYCPERRMFWILHNNKPVQAKIIEHGNKKMVYFLPQNKLITPQKPTLLFKPAKKEPQEQDLTQIKSPLSGSVVKILVEPGRVVNQGQTLLTIESMKMENEIKAPFNLVIQTIPITEGSVVQQSQVLITLIPIATAPIDHGVDTKENYYGEPK